MHKIFRFLSVIFVAASQVAAAGEITLYSFEGRSLDIEWSEHGEEDATTFLDVYRIGHKVAVINDEEISDLQSILEVAIEYDSSMDPFFGPGFAFLAKDSEGRHYILELEYVKDHKAFDGRRGSIARIQPIGNVAGIFINPASIERPSGGSTFDKKLLQHLLQIVTSREGQDPTTEPTKIKKQNKAEEPTPNPLYD